MIEIWDNLLLFFFATCVVIYGACQLHFDQELFKSQHIFTSEHNLHFHFGFGIFVLLINTPFTWSLVKNQGEHWFFAAYLVIIQVIQMVYFGIKCFLNYRHFYKMTKRMTKVLGQEFKLVNSTKLKTDQGLFPVGLVYTLDGIKRNSVMTLPEVMNYKSMALEIEKHLLKELDPLGNKSFDYFVTQAPKESI